jgi:hypothetical protein
MVVKQRDTHDRPIGIGRAYHLRNVNDFFVSRAHHGFDKGSQNPEFEIRQVVWVTGARGGCNNQAALRTLDVVHRARARGASTDSSTADVFG